MYILSRNWVMRIYLDAAAVHTIVNGGTVYAVEPDKVRDEAPLAAVFRY